MSPAQDEACRGDGEFAVILERASAKPDADIGRLLAYHLQLHPTDAIARVRYGGGLVIESVSEAIAEDLVERLRGLGVQARKISNSLWSYVPRGVRAFGVNFLNHAITVRLIGGRRLEVPRQEVFALQVYGLLPEETRQATSAERKKRKNVEEEALSAASPALVALSLSAGTGAEAAAGAGAGVSAFAVRLEAGSLGPRGQTLHDRLVEAKLERLELHLALYADTLGPIRIQKNDFDFTCLGPDRAEHSLDNFILLLERVLAYLPQAWNRERATKLLETLDPKPIQLFKPEEAENLERWLYEHSRLEAVALAESKTPKKADES